MTTETVRAIQIGLSLDRRPAVTLQYDSGKQHTIIFSLPIAKQLSWGLADLCERLTPHEPGDGTSVGEGCSISLTPPKED